MRLTGIADMSMGNFYCIRGFAPMIELANFSMDAQKMKRITTHKESLGVYLKVYKNGKAVSTLGELATPSKKNK